jgi:hypothetical protein
MTMAGDFSRVRSNPLADFAGVELKQGGVLLDGDVNELVAIVDRRLRALASDTLGRATVSRTTPDAFKINVAAGKLLIDRGRMYVDGLMAENHGLTSDDPAKPSPHQFDSLLAEDTLVDRIPYDAQPFLRVVPELPTAGRHLVYLDVWNREVTHLENPALVETAVAVETSSRIQTVWQVRVFMEVAAEDVNCSTPDAAMPTWSTHIAPSTGVLTTGTVDIAPSNDPCDLPPTGGYRGPENQLYRVQIHDAGQPGGQATFKWSRENASVGSRVARIVSATELELDSLGRDEVLSFNSDDWVEIIDDAHEFDSGAGEMRKITVNAAGNIVFAPALPAAMVANPFPDTSLRRQHNMRVRRWDQRGKVLQVNADGTTAVFQDLNQAGAPGIIKVPPAGTKLLLENGITVSFDTTGPKGFKAGDHWEFAARTSDATVEPLTRAAPRGIHHHFARLGIWDVAAQTVTDCRQPLPVETVSCDCMCTACITPEDLAANPKVIQEFVERYRDSGGTLCLTAGTYVLEKPVRLGACKSLRIRGQGSATTIFAPGIAFEIERSAGIDIQDLTVVSTGLSTPVILVNSVLGLTLRGLIVGMFGGSDAQGAAIELTGVVIGASIAANLLIAPDGVRALAQAPDNMLMTSGLRIDDNAFVCRDAGVKLAGSVAHANETRITGNRVLGTHEVGFHTEGAGLPGASLRIERNDLDLHGPGIRCCGVGVWIEGNRITATHERDRMLTGSGIELMTGLDKSGSDQIQVLANQINGFLGTAIAISTPVDNLIVKLNIIKNCGNGIVMTDSAQAGAVSIDNNQLEEIGSLTDAPQDSIEGMTIGIAINNTHIANVTGNTIRKVGLTEQREARLIAGIAAFAVLHPRFNGNVVSELGPTGSSPDIVIGIAIHAPYLKAEIAHNLIERNTKFSFATSKTAWFAVRIDEPTKRELPLLARSYRCFYLDASRRLVLFGKYAHTFEFIGDIPVVRGASAELHGSSASLHGNVLSAMGSVPAVAITAGEVAFGENRCELRPFIADRGDAQTPVVLLNTRVAIINANRVRGSDPSIQFGTPVKVAAVGNITTGKFSPSLELPMQALNLISE